MKRSAAAVTRFGDLSAALTIACAALLTPMFLSAANKGPGGALAYLLTLWAAAILAARALARRAPRIIAEKRASAAHIGAPPRSRE